MNGLRQKRFVLLYVLGINIMELVFTGSHGGSYWKWQTGCEGKGLWGLVVEECCDVPYRIGENVPGAIYVEVPLNQVDAF